MFRLDSCTRAFWVGAVLTFAGRRARRGRRGRRLQLGDERQPHRDLHRADVGVLHGRDRAAHAEVLALPDQRGRARARLGAARARLDPADLDASQFHFGGLTWLGFAYAVVGPLFLTNILWFTAVARVGAPRAVIVNNLQPFVGVLFALLLLSESLHPLEIVGGVLIFIGIYLERRMRHQAVAAAALATPE